jgi:Predicted pPIWI-associating nuclease
VFIIRRTWSQTENIVKSLSTDFQQDVFDAAMKSFEDSNNPLRLNNFATALRELSRIVLSDLASDQKIQACSW